MALALVRDLREHRTAASAEELADLETDLLAGFVLARASARLADSTIRNDTGHLELIRDWVRPAAAGDAAVRRGYLLRQGAPRGEAVDAYRPGGRADGVLPVPPCGTRSSCTT